MDTDPLRTRTGLWEDSGSQSPAIPCAECRGSVSLGKGGLLLTVQVAAWRRNTYFKRLLA